MNTKENIPDILLPKVDIVFKMLFGDKRNERFLIEFLETVLEKKIQSVELLNPTIKQLSKDDKLSILDVKAKLAIIIVAESLIFESQKCHNVFSMLEKEELFPFNNLQEIHILDLSRIENEKNESLSDWLKFINSEKEEEFMAVARKNKTIKAALDELVVMSADKQRRMIYEGRLKQQRDILSITNGARREGLIEGRQEERRLILDILKQQGIDVNLIKSKLPKSFA